MEQLSNLQQQKQEVEDTLASQLAATKEELMTERAKFEKLKRQLEIANDKLSESKILILTCYPQHFLRSIYYTQVYIQWNSSMSTRIQTNEDMYLP